MSEEEFKPYKESDILQRAMNYLCHVFVLKNMLHIGIITADDYEKAENPEDIWEMYKFQKVIK